MNVKVWFEPLPEDGATEVAGAVGLRTNQSSLGRVGQRAARAGKDQCIGTGWSGSRCVDVDGDGLRTRGLVLAATIVRLTAPCNGVRGQAAHKFFR